MFEQSATAVGSDFQAAPFWDLYLEYEDRIGAYDNILTILERIIHIPMAKHEVYWNKFRELAWVRPLENLQPAEEIARVRSAIESEVSTTGQYVTPHEIDHRMRIHFIDNMYLGIHNNTEIEIKKRSPFEERIQRLYFNIEELSQADLETWHKYLDFEEAEGDYNRIVALYDRCLVPCALYDKLWFRYARWMTDQPGKTEELRNIFRRASIFTPTARPYIRVQWARWEESLITEATRQASAPVLTYSPGSHPLAIPHLQQPADLLQLPPPHEGNRLSVAKDIHREILVELPNYREGIIALAHIERRHNGLDAALGVILKYIEESGTNIYTKGGLLSEYAMMIWETEGNADKARQLFERVEKQYRDNRKFWTDWMSFETSIPTTPATIDEQLERVRALIKKIREEANLPLDLTRDLTNKFLCYIEAHGGANAMEEYIFLDKDSKGLVLLHTLQTRLLTDSFRPFTIQHTLKKKLAHDGNEQTTDRRRYLEAGHPGLEINDADIARGIDPYEHYYKEQGESSRPAGHRDPVRIRGHP